MQRRSNWWNFIKYNNGLLPPGKTDVLSLSLSLSRRSAVAVQSSFVPLLLTWLQETAWENELVVHWVCVIPVGSVWQPARCIPVLASPNPAHPATYSPRLFYREPYVTSQSWCSLVVWSRQTLDIRLTLWLWGFRACSASSSQATRPYAGLWRLRHRVYPKTSRKKIMSVRGRPANRFIMVMTVVLLRQINVNVCLCVLECVFERDFFFWDVSVADFSSAPSSWEINTNVINIANQSSLHFPKAQWKWHLVMCYLIRFSQLLWNHLLPSRQVALPQNISRALHSSHTLTLTHTHTHTKARRLHTRDYAPTIESGCAFNVRESPVCHASAPIPNY